MNMEEGIGVFNDVLEHHGILGQKWGVKNGPPYPLDGSVPTEQKTRMSSLMKSEIQRLFKDENEGSPVNPSKFDDSKIRYDSIKPGDSHYLNVRHSIINQGRVSKEVLDDKNPNKSTYYLVNKERKDTRPGFISVIDTKDGTTYLATYAQEGLINQDGANRINESIKKSIRINSQKIDHSDMSADEGLDFFNDVLEHSGKWTWPNGNNSSEYNKWYYETVTKVKNGAQDLADAAADKWNNRGNEVKYIDEDTVMMPDGTYRSREWYEAHKDGKSSPKEEKEADIKITVTAPNPITNGGSDNNWHEDDRGIYRTNDDEWRHQQARKSYADKEKKKRTRSKQSKSVSNLMYAVDRYVTHSDMSVEDGVDLFNDVLEHHGIMGMKWGVKNGPPYPLGADDHNASERRANWEQSLKKAGSALKKGAEGTGAFIKKTAQNTSAEIHRRSEASKAAKAEKIENKRRAEEEQRNQDRRTAINTANVQYAENNFADMSEAEINEMLRRVDLKARVDRAAGIGKEEKKTFVDTVDNIANGVNKVSNWATTGINTYNTVAKVYNSFNEEKMPVIDGDFATRKAEEKKKKEAKAREAYYKLAIADPSQVNRSVLAYLDDTQRKNVEAEIDRIEKKNKTERELREATEKKEYEAAEAKRKQMAIDEYDARVEDLYRTIRNDPSSLTPDKVSNYSTDEINSAIDRSNATINLEKAKAGEYVGKGGGGGGKNPSNNNPSNNSPTNTNDPVDQDAIDDAIDERLRQLGLL